MADRLSGDVEARFRAPAFALPVGEEPAVAVGVSGARAAGSLVEIHLRRDAGGAVVARFRAYGDPATIAAADWVCSCVDGQPLGAGVPDVPAVISALSLPGRRTHAAANAVAALKSALNTLD